MIREIAHKYFFSHSPQEVWEYLTRSDLMEQWLMKNDFQPVVGHDFQFHTRPLPNFEFDGTVYCRVLEIIPFKKLSYSWKGGPGNGEMTMDSVVYWTLEPSGSGTNLYIRHTGFEGMENLSIFHAMNEGWLQNIRKIDELLGASIQANDNT